ncbi:MAG TPA: nicotinate-nucleotide adenylyltransferase [Patescibacteria group bacterium]|nr:nicotinate-nucleotide adenylyltransferase [Patescibacteria group bacterium]
MNPPAPRTPGIALFGGAFNPIHSGHLAVARAACRHFRLDRVYFIPAGRPPHKASAKLTAFEHRYAMVALACAGDRRFIPSLVEAGTSGKGRFFYTIDTVQRFRRELEGTATRLYFIAGADAFLHIETWKEYRRLLRSCEFIVAHRPGFRLKGPAAGEAGALAKNQAHLLRAVSSKVSSTQIRHRQEQGRSIRGLVPAPVEEYIEKQALYCE